MKSLQKIAQWVVSVPLLILGVSIGIDLGFQYSIPFILAGLVINPLITKTINIAHKKLILIASSLVLCVIGLAVFPVSTPTSNDVPVTASSTVEEVASSVAEEPASSEQENSQDTVKEYMQLIDRAYNASSFDSIDKNDKKTFKKILKSDTEIANFTKAWKQYFKNHMTTAQTNGTIDDLDNMKFLDDMISLYENFLPNETNRISSAVSLNDQFKKDDQDYRDQFNSFFRGYKTPGNEYSVPDVYQMSVDVYYKMDTTYADTAAKIQDTFNHDKHDLYYAKYYADEKGGYWAEVEVETDDSFFFPKQGTYNILFVWSSSKATIVDSNGFKSEIDRIQLLGDESDYSTYESLCDYADAMKQYPSDVWNLAMSF